MFVEYLYKYHNKQNILLKGVKNMKTLLRNYKPTKELFAQTCDKLTIASIKTLAKGRLINKKDGTQYFTCNDIALRIFTNPYSDADIISDLKNEVTLKVLECYKARLVWFVPSSNVKTKKRECVLVCSSDEVRRDIFNIVQNYIYDQRQKHYNHAYDEKLDAKGEVIDYTLHTKEIRNNILDTVDDKMVFSDFNVCLSDLQKDIIKHKLNSTKIVKKVEQYTEQNKTLYRTVEKSVRLTNADIAELLKTHEQTIKYNLKAIQAKATNYLSKEVILSKEQTEQNKTSYVMDIVNKPLTNTTNKECSFITNDNYFNSNYPVNKTEELIQSNQEQKEYLQYGVWLLNNSIFNTSK